MVRKVLVWSLFSLMLIGFFAIAVWADEVAELPAPADDVADAAKGALSGAGDWLSSALAPFFGEKEMLTRVFFAILLFMIVQPIVSQIFKKGWVSWIVGGIVTLLALLALPSNFIEAIRVQYGAMGAAILSIIPFIILLIFTIKLQSKLMARLLWIFFVGYYFLLYLDKVWVGKQAWLSGQTIPYVGAIVLGLVIVIFIGHIRNLLFKGELDSEEEQAMRDINFRDLGRELEREETKSRLALK